MTLTMTIPAELKSRWLDLLTCGRFPQAVERWKDGDAVSEFTLLGYATCAGDLNRDASCWEPDADSESEFLPVSLALEDWCPVGPLGFNDRQGKPVEFYMLGTEEIALSFSQLADVVTYFI